MKRGKPTLGSLLRALRARNGWTLKEMSERTDIPVSTLSKVEHDRLTLTYDKLVQLSERLNIRMSELFADPTVSPARTPPVTARRSVGTSRGRGPGQHQELRLLLHVPGAAAETHDSD